MSETFIGHCVKFYEALNAVSIDHSLDDGEVVRRFAGKVTEVYVSTGIAQTYYSPIIKQLEKMGAIHKVQRGGRNADTVYVLNGLPDMLDPVWEGVSANNSGLKTLTSTHSYAKLAEQVRELDNLLGGINVLEALEELDSRLKTVEATLILLTPKHRSKKFEQ